MRIGYGSTALAAVLLATTVPAFAQTAEPVRQYQIASGPLDRALTAFARQSGLQILYPSALVAGRSSAGVIGSYSAEGALAQVLRDTGLTYRRTRPNVFVLVDPAQRAEAEFDTTQLDEVVVTGSYLRGVDSPSPVTVLTQDDVARQGRATVAEALAALPQNFTGAAYEGSANTGADRSGRNVSSATGVNLRGLGADATLVLVNGRRVAGTGNAGDFADISNIPSSAISRADVLLDGASALYGADAVGGVVNIILKSRFDGAESRLRIGGTSDGGAEELLFSQTGGFNWASGSLVAAYEYHDRGELEGADRSATRDADLRRLGGSDRRQTFSAPGNIMRFDAATGIYTPIYAIPEIQNGVGLTPASFIAGRVNRTSPIEGQWFLPHQERQSLFLAGRQNLPGGFSLDGDIRYTDRSYILRTNADFGTFTVTSANPHFVSPNGSVSHDIAYSWINDLGPARTNGETESLGGAFGIDGNLFGWNISAYASGGREINGRTLSNRVQTTFLAEALGSRADIPTTPFTTARDGFFNPFGDPAANSPAILAHIGSGYSWAENVSTVSSFNVKADGTLLELPGGPLQMALGFDFRQEQFETDGVSFLSGTAPRVAAHTEFARDVAAAFFEIRAPLVSADNARPGLERLELSLAARYEEHEGVGETTNPKVGVLYSPTQGLLLRASYGTSFRAPSLRELQTAYAIGPTFLNRNGGSVLSLIQYGGNPDLRPETADSITAGFVWTPAAYEGFRLEGGWFRTRFDDRIGNPVIQNLTNALNEPALAPFIRYVSPNTNADDRALVQALLDHPGNFNPAVFPATSYGAVVDNRFVNASGVEVEGFDLSARYRFDLGSGQALLDGTITHLLTNERTITAASPTEDLLGDPNFPARWRGRIGSQWVSGPLTFGLIANYVSGGRDPLGGRRIDDWTTFDGQVRYDFADGWGEGLSLTFNVLNLANAEPPFYDATSGIAYDPANTNALGRQLSLQLVKRW
ncbi:TonB-dependent receptor [Brevundimonas variabilis]|uniref:Outer membrane receptor protein involved in Fe transport n=1 Tax=Brevundimonas variabilis TaxID=74312 RepID=A0A7W9FGK2_9CAUL|nr:TonB-dependent receptor [Brevundimonas variabilis]MBB5746534.1 outer membrane receptor protein involved in Fe transport [Brevundimonas variabilis]